MSIRRGKKANLGTQYWLTKDNLRKAPFFLALFVISSSENRQINRFFLKSPMCSGYSRMNYSLVDVCVKGGGGNEREGNIFFGKDVLCR